MKKVLSLAMSLAAGALLATTVTYNDLGEFAGQSNDFWDTTAHASFTYDKAAGNVTGFDVKLAGSTASATVTPVDTRQYTVMYSALIGFTSHKPGCMIIFR